MHRLVVNDRVDLLVEGRGVADLGLEVQRAVRLLLVGLRVGMDREGGARQHGKEARGQRQEGGRWGTHDEVLGAGHDAGVLNSAHRELRRDAVQMNIRTPPLPVASIERRAAEGAAGDGREGELDA